MLFLALLAAAPFQFHVDNAEFPNAVFHLSCLSDRVPCTKPQVEKFWHGDLQWTNIDQHQLDAWNAALDGVSGRQVKPPESPFLPNYGDFYPGPAAVRRIIAAGLDSHSPAEFRKHAATFASPNEIAQLSAALAHFERRLRPWWHSKGAPYAAARQRPIETLMNAPGVSVLGDRIARFMESEITSRKFRIHLIPRSDPKSDGAIATVVGNHVLAEVIDAMRPDEALPYMMHELTHALYDLAPLRLHQQLIRDFVASSEPNSQPLYALLNEGIATAVQITLMRQTMPDQDIYRDPFIPRIGRAVAGPLARALENGPTLYHGFLGSYLRASAAELKEELASPRFILSTAMPVSIGKLDEAEKACQSYLVTHWAGDFAERNRFSEVNLMVLITYDRLDAISDNWSEIIPLSQAHRGFAFSAPRNTKGHWYVLAGRDDTTVAEVVQRLAAIRTGTGDGVVLTID
ncbi:hypothetical protein SBA3_60024 [Candidatus Sulfopaludibacter sp. SbA3]|nr:hypothetical protein SBA3_60024 [Candidatus Sulfopaludibacter sp. SbA3]